MELVKALFDLIVGISWPASIVALALIFQGEIRKAIGRVKKAGLAGVELDQQSLAPSTFSATGELKKFPANLPRTPLMGRVERSIHEALALHAPDVHIDLLVRELALTRIQRLFESIWGIIFNSQIKALQAIKAANGTMDRRGLEPFYQSVAAELPEDWTFESWSEYLVVTSELVETDGAKLKATELGDDFLSWLPSKGALRRSY